MKIRIKFTKQGAMKFIGHLDIMRYFQKAMRRADIPIRYSEGFSPHQIMSFASPLGVGLTSNGEYLDIEVTETGSSRQMIDCLNQVMAEGIEVTDYRMLPDASKTAMSMVAAADYTVVFRNGYEPEDWKTFADGLIDFCAQDSIMITKQTKKGEKEMDLKPYLYQVCVRDRQIFLQLSAGSAANIKPELVISAYCAAAGRELPPFALCIQREEVYADQGDETGRNLIPLYQLGEWIE